MRIAVDVGGTFTDVIVLDESRSELRLEKAATTPKDPSQGVLLGLRKTGVDFASISHFVHGTTLGLNAIITRTGARVAIVTTKGFRDVFELGRTARDAMYDFTYRKPEPLVSRRFAFEVTERMTFDGQVHTPFDEEEARRVAERIRSLGVESVAVSFLHSYANPAHEEAMARVLAEVCPEVSVTLSHRLSREYREYERTSTAVVDAYIKPIVQRYLHKLDGELRREGFRGQFLMTRSGGGAMTVASAAEQPVHLVNSGPAGGAIGAAYFSRLTGRPNIITLDMGGTSLDTCLVVGGDVRVNSESKVEHWPVQVPMIDIRTLGAGGGSIAWIDPGGHLQMGPASAGADPGPACYGKGGSQPTFTDAALVCGYLDPANFLGGEMALDARLAEDAIRRVVAEPLGLSLTDAASAMIRISEAKIEGAIREISVEQGHHPRDFALLAFGGAGGFVAAAVAREIGIPVAIVPPGPANFSALGMLMVDVVHDFAQTYVTGLDDLDLRAVNEILATLAERGRAALRADGFDAAHTVLEPSVEMRYQGQEHTVRVPLARLAIETADKSSIVQAFNAAHEAQYGHHVDDPVEIVTLRLRAIGTVTHPSLPRVAPGRGADSARKGERDVHRFGAGEPIRYAVFDRTRLGAGDRIEGPAIVEEPSSTTLVHAGDRAEVGEFGEIVITIGGEPA
ncbi:MAG: hydantoinase/oxoprolinase family protein [Clostridia bacterium]|nr:hydantoinase/oxoprolinase family protein [Clostridia bacterium]